MLDQLQTARQSAPAKPAGRVRVGHVVVGSVLAGAQRCMLDICGSLDPSRFACEVICHEEGPLTDALRQGRIPYHLVPSLDRPIRPHRDWAGLLQIARICRERRFDIVHTHSSKGGLLGRIAARAAGVPIVIHHVHGYPFHEFSGTLERFTFTRLEKFAARFCDLVVFVNDEERELSVGNRWIPSWKGITVYNGTSLDLFDARRNGEHRYAFRCEHRLAEDELAILVSGRLERQKQPLILPEIATSLDALRPRAKWRILVAGSGDLEEALRAEVHARGMTHRVELIGWTPEPHKVVSGTDVMLLPSLWEGLPLVLIEAQAAGLPIVASDVKGNREVVTPDTGFLCRPREAGHYAEALAALCDDGSLRRRFGSAARRRAESLFDLSRNLDEISGIYENLVSVIRGKPADFRHPS